MKLRYVTVQIFLSSVFFLKTSRVFSARIPRGVKTELMLDVSFSKRILSCLLVDLFYKIPFSNESPYILTEKG